jgi:hypothetical protein
MASNPKHRSNVKQFEMLATSTKTSDVTYHPALNDALRDLRFTNGRSVANGEGVGNDSKASLLVGFTIIDTIAGKAEKATTAQRANWFRLLSQYGFNENECSYLLATHLSLAHGYSTPKPIANHRILLSGDPDVQAIDVGSAVATISVPSVNTLVEEIAAQHYGEWDTTLLDPDIHLK